MNRGNPRYERIAELVNMDALAFKRVTLIGAGSMGLSIATQMARHGVATCSPGQLRIIDGDRVEERDLIGTEYRMKHLGTPKVDAAASIVHEINPHVNISYWEKMIDDAAVSRLVEVAGQTDLLGLFTDSCDVMLKLAKSCAGICPQVMAAIGLYANYAEVAFSIPGVTVPIGVTMGSGKMTAIGTMGSRKRTPLTLGAFGCDTAYIASFVASLCLELLLAPEDRGKLVCCHADAPLFLIGVREPWLFQNEPEETCRSVSCVYAGPNIRRSGNAAHQSDDDQ